MNAVQFVKLWQRGSILKKITEALVLATSVLASGSAVAAVDFVDYTGTVPSNTITVASATITLSSPVVNAW